jgi:protein-L-isoaspartate(D-aspartate) O-methyltransferase
MDDKALRDHMVKTQLIPRGIQDNRVLEVMRRVPRHLFVEKAMMHNAYNDMALPISDGQTISQPYMVAVMTELLELSGNEKVLEIGTGSGYQAAILAELSKEVYSIERIASLTEKVKELLDKLGYDNIHVMCADGTQGWPDAAPFDRIMITAAAPQIPDPLKDQLADDGILVIPVGSRFSQQLLKVRKSRDRTTEEYHTPCVFVPLIGEHGWESDD